MHSNRNDLTCCQDVASAVTGIGKPTYTAHIYPSRQSHKPRLEVDRSDGSSIAVDLEINSSALPPDVEARLTELGFDEAHDGALVLQGMWEKWRMDDMLRLKATLGHSEGAVTLYVTCFVIASPRADRISNDVSGLLDPFASHRRPDVVPLPIPLAETKPAHPLETLASKANLFYHKSRRGGNIGCYGYGAGSAMSTMDVLAVVGGKPTNFLDGGGGATEANVRAALDVLMQDEDVDVAFVNTFGGLTRTVSL